MESEWILQLNSWRRGDLFLKRTTSSHAQEPRFNDVFTTVARVSGIHGNQLKIIYVAMQAP
jgi:hypothetical protein